MRTSVNLDTYKKNDLYSPEFATWVKVLIELIQPKDLYAVMGRATAKTTMIQAGRFMDISYDMNHAWFAWAATTYMDAMDNIVPVLIEGLKLQGWKEGRHFVTDAPPPSHFKRPFKAPKSYKHTISTYLGTFTQIVSMDQVSSAAGGSFQHLFADELKNIQEKKLKKLIPAIRGGDYLTFSRTPFYRGRTFTTDMPNITEGEHDHILAMEKNMDTEQMRKILEISLVLNDIKIKFFEAYKRRNPNELKKIQKDLMKWKEMWYRARKDSTMFLVASTFANADILTQGFFDEVLKSEGIYSFRTTIVSLKPTVKHGDRFYSRLGLHHFYDDGVRNEYYDNFNLVDTIKPTSEALRYCVRDQKLEGGADFGNMCSFVVGQTQRNYIYVLKEFHTLAPKSVKELAEEFRQFFRKHNRKELDLYYDRAGNANAATKRDWASNFKHHLEFDEDGKRTGWVVNLMSLNQGNINQADEYKTMQELMGETNADLPRLKIDTYQCRHLKSSLELAKIVMKKDRNGSTVIGKNKASEKLPLHQLPLYSTNYSDAFKYFICRRDWMNAAGRKEEIYVG